MNAGIRLGICIGLLVLSSVPAHAGLPRELEEFFPPKYKPIRVMGRTSDRLPCQIKIERYSTGDLVSSVTVLDRKGQPIEGRYEQFQIGLGFYFLNYQETPSGFMTESYHEPDEWYRNDLKSTLRVLKSHGRVKAVQVTMQEKVFNTFRTLVKETCLLR